MFGRWWSTVAGPIVGGCLIGITYRLQVFCGVLGRRIGALVDYGIDLETIVALRTSKIPSLIVWKLRLSTGLGPRW